MIDYQHLRLEVEAEEPRNKIVMPNPPVGLNATNRYAAGWTGLNGASWSPSTLTIPASTAAGTRVAESPLYPCVPGGPVSASLTLTQSNYQSASVVLVGYTSGGTLVGDIASGSTAGGFTQTGAIYPNARGTAPATVTQFRVVIVRQGVVGTSTPNLGIPPLEQFVSAGPTIWTEWPTRNNTTVTAENGAYALSSGSSRLIRGRTFSVTPGHWLGAAVTVSQSANLYVEWIGGPGGSVNTGAAVGTRTIVTQVPTGVTGARLRVSFAATAAATVTDVILVTHVQYEYARRTTPAESARPNNLISNPSGELGGVGWASPGPGYMVRDGAYLKYLPNNGGRYFISDAVPVTPGKWMGASWTIKANDPWRQRIEFLDSDGAVLSTSTPTSPWALSTSMVGAYTESFYADPFQVPAGAVYARMRFDTYYGPTDAANDSPDSAGSTFPTWVRQVTMSEHDTQAEAVALPYADPGAKWRDWLSPASSVSISRDELDTGRMTAVLRHELLDPATTTEIEVGRAVRLLLQGEAVYTGRVDTVSGVYRPEGGLPTVTVTAVDGNARLAGATRPEAVGTVSATAALVEGTGVPWRVNGSSDQVASFTAVARNDNATALDGISLMRDTTGAIAYLDRFGWLVADDRPSTVTPVAAIDEAVYSRPDISFSTEDLVNEVRVTVQEIDAAGETVERPGGVYRLDSSVARHGVYSREYTITPLDPSPAAVKAWADDLLAANGTPQVSINDVLIPIDTLAKKPFALLDLYAPVTVSNAARGISKVRRVRSIAHDITPGGWSMRVSFTGTESRAQAQVTPSPPQDRGQSQREDVSSLITWGSGTVTVFRDGPWRHLRGSVSGNLPTGSTDFLDALQEADRPSAVEFGSAYIAGGYSGVMFAYADGRMTLRNDTGAARSGAQQFTIVYAVK